VLHDKSGHKTGPLKTSPAVLTLMRVSQPEVMVDKFETGRSRVRTAPFTQGLF